jgi:hypothetical protein
MSTFYRHFRNGSIYEVFGEARHHESLEPLVLYRNVVTGQQWVREKENFEARVETVLDNKVPYAGPRFIKLQLVDRKPCPNCERIESLVVSVEEKKAIEVCTKCSFKIELKENP